MNNISPFSRKQNLIDFPLTNQQVTLNYISDVRGVGNSYQEPPAYLKSPNNILHKLSAHADTRKKNDIYRIGNDSKITENSSEDSNSLSIYETLILPVSSLRSDEQDYSLPFKTNHPFVYRVDTRDYNEINKLGFTGTASINHMFATFNTKTVFTAATIGGVKAFLKSALLHDSNQRFHLYKIKTSGMKVLEFRSAYESDPKGLINHIANLKFEKHQDSYTGMKKFQRLGKDNFIKQSISPKIQESLEEAFIKVDEVHVEGPVPPGRITLMKSYWSG